MVMCLFIDTVIPNKNMNEIVMGSGVLLVIMNSKMVIEHRDTILEAMDRVFVLHDKQFSDGMSVQELYENEAFKTLFSYSERGR